MVTLVANIQAIDDPPSGDFAFVSNVYCMTENGHEVMQSKRPAEVHFIAPASGGGLRSRLNCQGAVCQMGASF